MHRLWILVVVAGCAAEDRGPTPPATIGSGELALVTWDGGPCPRDYHCSGELELAGATFTARFSDDALVAMGQLSQATVDDLATLVAAIPSDAPIGVLLDDNDGPGISETWIRLDGELRVYVSNGFFPSDLGTKLYDVRAAIEVCASASLVASFTSCTPQL
ncbi:MAG TPA: hypothetical protein VIV11_12425 [Kofleriaceae bacterium]